MFVFEGKGVVKDYLGTLTDYAECLIERENDFENGSAGAVDSHTKKTSYKENKAQRLDQRNRIKKLQRELSKFETQIEKLKSEASDCQAKIDGSTDEGWTVLAELTDNLNNINAQVEKNELKWLEIAEELECISDTN